jgi:lysophospholipase L1-like esterase
MSSSSEPQKKSRLKRFLQNGALFLGVFGLCVLAFEIALRLAGYGNVEIYEPDPVLYWKLKPNQRCFTKIDRKPVHINSHGTRGPEFSAAKPVNTIRIISLGDSKTFGWGLSEAETYSSLLEKWLREQVGAGRKVEVINAGVNAYSYPQMCAYFKTVALKYSPDIVVIGDANLWTQFSENNSREFVDQFMMRVRLKNFLRRFAMYHYIVEVKLKAVYERQRTKFIPVDPKSDTLFKEQQAKDPDAFFRNSIEQLCRAALTNNVKPVLLYMPRLPALKAPEEPNNEQRAKKLVSQTLNVPLVDVSPEIAPGAETLYLEADPVHFNIAGNQIIARKLFETVSTMVIP